MSHFNVLHALFNVLCIAKCVLYEVACVCVHCDIHMYSAHCELCICAVF